MPEVNVLSTWGDSVSYWVATTVSLAAGATQNIAVTGLAPAMYSVYGLIVATGLDAATPTVAYQPFIDAAGSIQISGQEYMHMTGSATGGRSVLLSSTPFNVHFIVTSANATIFNIAIPIVYGSRIQVVRNTATVGTVGITLIFQR